ncbi:multidrug effflux MFS transporter [Nitrogeniibacter mangrovi]|uniref:Bcr/CflA family efflux transporter n=1 Tax=Nitrogeniibacter mangrovi TaxID=2016596 RepID=A0A6C1B7A7_9RHOO|nr:multidrug effflux MFS transporter [Nitrogeniibacter mangrovi]QID19357.1 multidrug effflux MFS transporter [Nitrogeniibacter mangrovi]
MPVSIRVLAPILAALAALGPFSIDTYLPAFHDIAADLGASRYEVQLTLTAYLIPFALMVFWHGALSDSFGRRRVILAALSLYAVASAVCALAPGIEWLWIGRALQGLCGGAGIVVGRAVVRDVLEGPQAQRLMSHVVMMFAIAPAVAPILGGAILAVLPWQAIFWFLALLGALLGAVSYFKLPETHPPEKRQSLHPVNVARGYGSVLRSGRFLLIGAAIALNFNGFFLYVLSAPTFLVDHLGVSEQGFGWLFIPAMVGMMTGAWLSGRVASHWTPGRTILTGFAAMGAAAAVNVGINQGWPPSLPLSILPVPLYVLGMSMAMPNLTLMALDLFPARRGMVSSCQSFMQTATNALTAGVFAPLLWASTARLSLGMGAYLSLGFLAYLGVRRLQQRSA